MKTSLLPIADCKLLNEAVQRELYASNFYKYAASCCQKQGLFGAQKFFEAEAADETTHYFKIRDFMNDMGDEAEMPEIMEVEFKKEKLADIFDAAYELEKGLGDFYNKFYFGTKCAPVQTFLIKMVNIQRKSVGEYGDKIAQLEQYGVALFDIELGK
jgi:bacterioferritin (cytochrome b1)